MKPFTVFFFADGELETEQRKASAASAKMVARAAAFAEQRPVAPAQVVGQTAEGLELFSAAALGAAVGANRKERRSCVIDRKRVPVPGCCQRTLYAHRRRRRRGKRRTPSRAPGRVRGLRNVTSRFRLPRAASGRPTRNRRFRTVRRSPPGRALAAPANCAAAAAGSHPRSRVRAVSSRPFGKGAVRGRNLERRSVAKDRTAA